jgi:hypothetical protein
MNPILTTCPVCEERLSITRLHCRNCDTTIEGHFDFGRLGRLKAEQNGTRNGDVLSHIAGASA